MVSGSERIEIVPIVMQIYGKSGYLFLCLRVKIVDALAFIKRQ